METDGKENLQAGRDIHILTEGTRAKKKQKIVTDVEYVKTVLRIQAIQIALLIIISVILLIVMERQRQLETEIRDMQNLILYKTDRKKGE